MTESVYKMSFREQEAAPGQIRLFVFLAYIFSLPFDMFYSSVIFGTLVVMTLLSLRRGSFSALPRTFWIFQAVFLLSVSGYAYSYNKGAAGFLIERQLTIALLPVILPLAIRITAGAVRAALHTLLWGTLIASFYLLATHVYFVLVTLELPANFLVSGAFLNHQFSRPLGIHAGYLSLYVALSLFYSVHRLGSAGGRAMYICFVLSIMVLALTMVLLASRNSLIVALAVLLLVHPFFVRRKLSYIVSAGAIIGALVILFFSVQYLRERFSVFLLEDIGQAQRMMPGGGVLEPRHQRWSCALQLIPLSPLIGFGTGDEIGMLKSCYIRSGLYISYLEDFNAHNTYLSVVLKHGLAGLLLFCAAFIYYFRLALRSRSFHYLGFLLLITIGFYTENLLDANKGIVFFAVFNTLFGYAALRQEQRPGGSSADAAIHAP